MLYGKGLTMRQITYEAVQAFINGYNFKRSNTEVKYHVEWENGESFDTDNFQEVI
jgi:hypothetical protein